MLLLEKPLKSTIKTVGPDVAIEDLEKMLLIRQFEIRGEAAYQMGKVGGFYHSYIGQEAIQTAAVRVFGQEPWYIGFYRCHALALLLGASPDELMAELYGKSTGNVKGRGGSMHFVTKRLLGGFGIVGGQIPIAIGAAFTVQYLDQKENFAVCFLGDGAVAQGSFHESLNLASLWNLPVIFIIENNQWGMGTHVNRAIATSPIAETQAPSYGIKGYTVDGMDYFACHGCFTQAKQQVLKDRRPILIEAICERFKGHSISDPGAYRTKESLHQCMKKDPIDHLYKELHKHKLIDKQEFESLEKTQRETVVKSMDFAEKSPPPNETDLEEGVYAP